LVLLLYIYNILTDPLSNYLSRRFEYQADKFAVEATAKGTAFRNSLKKLSQLNLADEQPHPIVEFLFYSHPSINHRIEKIKGVHS
jgi:STE24 endopeptidase